MTASGDQSGTDSFWEDLAGDTAELSTTVFFVGIVLLAFSFGLIGFEWAVVAMLGLIAAASATE